MVGASRGLAVHSHGARGAIGKCLQVSVGSVSIVLEALAGYNNTTTTTTTTTTTMEDSILWIHPTMYDFLDEANELQHIGYISQEDKDAAIVQARLAPLPMEPPPAAAWSILDDSKTMAMSATLSKKIIQPIPDKGCLQIACVYLDPGVREVVQNDPTELQSLLSIGLQGRLVLVGAFLMSSTLHGMIILEVTGIQNKAVSQGHHQPMDISITYRLRHNSSFAM